MRVATDFKASRETSWNLVRHVVLQRQQSHQGSLSKGGRRRVTWRYAGDLRTHQRLDRLTVVSADAGQLRVGARGRAVLNLQRHLRAAELDPGPIDGIYGLRTRNAVRVLQRQTNAHPTGRADLATWEALREQLFPSSVHAAAGKLMGQARAPRRGVDEVRTAGTTSALTVPKARLALRV
jgi:peptidoglycan hydrolase-like protein with peptidoglycan-binding domain